MFVSLELLLLLFVSRERRVLVSGEQLLFVFGK